MFVGSTELTLDAKGRLILPTHHRGALADGAYLSMQDDCLGILPAALFEEKALHLQALVESQDITMAAFRNFTGNAVSTTPDSQGRIRITPELREQANLIKPVILAGALDHLEVWNPERYLEESKAGAPVLARAITDGRIIVSPSSSTKGAGEANP